MIAMGGENAETKEWDNRIFYAFSDKLKWIESRIKIPAELKDTLYSDAKIVIEIDEMPMIEENVDSQIIARTKIVVCWSKDNKENSVAFHLKEIVAVLIKQPFILGIYGNESYQGFETAGFDHVYRVCQTLQIIYGTKTSSVKVNVSQEPWLFDTKNPDFQSKLLAILKPPMPKSIEEFDSLLVYVAVHGKGNFQTHSFCLYSIILF